MHDDDTDLNPTDNAKMSDVMAARLTRRGALGGLLGAGLLAACTSDASSPEPAAPAPAMPPGVPGTPAPPGAPPPSPTTPPARPKPMSLRFQSVPKGLADTVVVPPGYVATALFALGDPISPSMGAYKNDGTEAGASFTERAGDHHDGMHYFGLGADGSYAPASTDRALLVMNHESITPRYLHAAGPTVDGTGDAAARTVADEVVKEIHAHGVSVIEVRASRGAWSYDRSSAKNRRVTAATPMTLSGPAAGSAHMITKYSATGTATRGTVNNCASGHTPWGTYLTCEENWAGYFRRLAADDASRTAKELAALARYGVAGAGRNLWATATPDDAADTFGRWNAEVRGASADGSDDYRNVHNTFGWVVEIDPFNPASTPKKRTALGRFAHEGCWLGPVKAGAPLVWYMGCDGRNEYIYKFVSKRPWDPADSKGGLAAGDKYMDEGTLYVARFDANGTGAWLELAFGKGAVHAGNAAYTFEDHADVLVHARLAADAAGATKMDRPEWGAVNPKNGEVYFTLTNTSSSARTVDKVDAANPRFYDDPKAGKAQKGNPNGHVIRFAETGASPAATSFTWDVYLFGARASADSSVNVSGLTGDNDLSSPDGLWFSEANPGLLWIQTDDGAYTDVTNCMMLAALPGAVGDGGKRTIKSADGAASKTVETRVGKTPSTDTLRRFLVGPRECEITGVAESPDGKALFVNVQHPGEDTPPDYASPASFGSHWPGGGLSRPRSATVVITRADGGTVGVDR
jgi:uncharacterized protein